MKLQIFLLSHLFLIFSLVLFQFDEIEAFERFRIYHWFLSLTNPRPTKKYKFRSYGRIARVITGNPYIHNTNIYSKTAIYPRQPFWTFTD